MKASFIILPALLMSVAANRRGGEKGAGSAQAPPRAPKRGWFGWIWTRRPAPKKTDAVE